MNSIKLSMTAQTPSCFGMPIYGSTSRHHPWHDAASRRASLPSRPTSRDRHVAGVQSLADGHVPGDLCLETTDLLTPTASAASRPRNPKPGIRGLSVSRRTAGSASPSDQVRRRR